MDHEAMHAQGIAHTHAHEHTHADGVTHSHAHAHDCEHAHEHNHEHSCGSCGHDCASCASTDPKAELIALMKYMVAHNTSHANELAQLAGKLKELGESVAFEQVMQAVSDFEKGNMRLTTVLAALNV